MAQGEECCGGELEVFFFFGFQGFDKLPGFNDERPFGRFCFLNRDWNLLVGLRTGGRGRPPGPTARHYTAQRYFEIGLLGLWFRGLSWRFRFGLPGVGIVGGFGIDAEIPDVEIHSFLSFHFD